MKSKRLLFSAAAAAGLLLLLAALGAFSFLPSDAAVARKFVKERPTATVLDVVRGEKGENGLAFDIFFKEPNSADIQTVHWTVYTDGVWFGWRHWAERDPR